MGDFWEGIFKNKVFWVTIFSWAFAQGVKIAIGLFKDKKFNFYWLMRTGGMPSVHSAAVAAMAFSLGKELGFSSPIFALSCIFALITMFDAQTWRRSVGIQARILNNIIADIQEKKKVSDNRIKELEGHTPVEVFAGAFLGIAIAFLLYK